MFSYDRVLSFEGETCPYVQYTGARCNSVLAKGGEIGDYTVDGMNDEEYAVLSLLGSFSDIVKSSAEKYEPSIITRYAVDLAEAYNKFYISSRIIDAPTELKNMRLALTKAVKITLTNATRLLGIEIPEKM